MADSLPVELWWKILEFLTGKDLCNVALVSNFFRRLAEEPALWSGVKINRDKIEDQGIDRLLSNYRLKKVKEVDLSYLDLTKENIENLQRIIEHFQRVRMRYSNVTNAQKEAILKSAITSKVLQDLDLDSIALSEIHRDLLTKALVGRNTVGLNNTDLNYDQLVTLLMSIPTSKVENLTLSGINLSDLPEQYLRSTISKVTTLDFSNTCLTPDQLSSILCECIWSISIEELNLTGAHFAGVSSQLLLDAAACLTHLNLCSAVLTRKQLFALLYSLTLDCSTLEDLNLSAQDVSSLPANLLAKSLSNLKTINLNYTKASTEQLTAVLRSLIKTKTVTTLELVRLDLSDVPVSDLVRPVSQLKTMNLNYAKLTSEQTISLLAAASRSQTLEHLGLVRANMKPVSLTTLKKALSVLKSVSLNYAQLTTEQQNIIRKR
eukprot:GFUD01003034.1.p1 GENE.GFUD01003034.1~~GFUD01003034.1.p1  ORF type:complete len:434 (+),score=103.81 GFUD01003034.1:56-1357(+)